MSRSLVLLALAAGAVVSAESGVAQMTRQTPRFLSDDPVRRDDDSAISVGELKEFELSENFDFLENTFGSPGDRTPLRAVNINTLDDVPDSSWFTNRIGAKEMPLDEIRRGPSKFERLDATEWTIVRGKGPGGFHPGFRASHPGDPKQVYQLEVDPRAYPQLATGAELIGTLIYHALGYNVVDVYPVRVDPAKIRIDKKATIRDASGTRGYRADDLDTVLRYAARDSAGRVYFSATRYEEGTDIGRFRYYGTRPDDPNDIHPHEHRRELRANRVFAAWLAHDDSRAVNTLNLLVEREGRRHVRHYMYDFGAVLGSATRFPDDVVSGHEYYFDKEASVRALASLGLALPDYLRADYPDMPPSAGFFTSVAFDPARWKANYPNPAFINMRPDDAFWGARLVSRFSDAALAAIVGEVGYDDPRAAEHLTRTLIERRDRIARVWLNGVNPLVDFTLAQDGSLTFANAAVAAGAATPASGYRLTWSRFDNEKGTHQTIGAEQRITALAASAPAEAAGAGEFVSVKVISEHPEHPAWAAPMQVYFRRTASGWKTVGLFR
ncbi:MAG TPA: hypothetical protein VNJ03_02435 [Vicinamibacterales bacterium]|nr:hypothetical protein [Vicinamibacterales bacterium]